MNMIMEENQDLDNISLTDERGAKIETEEEVSESQEPKKSRNPKAKWYILQAYAGYEVIVEQTIHEKLRIEKLEYLVDEIFIPSETFSVQDATIDVLLLFVTSTRHIRQVPLGPDLSSKHNFGTLNPVFSIAFSTFFDDEMSTEIPLTKTLFFFRTFLPSLCNFPLVIILSK